MRADGSHFTSLLSCVIYAAGGGEFGVVTPVTITSVTCDPTALGLIVTGTGCTNVTSVTVDGSNVTYVVNSDTQITIPAVSSGTAVVTTAAGGSASGALPAGGTCGAPSGL